MVSFRMGRVSKGVSCSISGCTGKAVRSISSARAESARLKVEDARHVYLCDTHYREFKKKNRRDMSLARMRWNAQM